MQVDPTYSAQMLETVGRAPVNNPQAVLGKMYAALIEQDYGALNGLLTEDVELRISGMSPMDGHWQGRGAVVEAAKKNFAMVREQKPEILSMAADGDTIAVLLQEHGVFVATGEPYALRCTQWVTFEGDRLKRIEQIATRL